MQQGQGMQQRPDVTTGANTRDQINTQAQSQGAARSMTGRFTVTAEQQSRLQQALNSRNVNRINSRSINFRVNPGVFVPRNIAAVSIAAAAPALIDIYPDFRDDSFFVVDDDIVVLDRSRRIVDVVPAGPRTRFARSGRISGGSGGSVAALDLSPQEIRVVQQVLIDDGLLTGEADGVFGTRTREALITFQRQQGIRATGSIDTNTVAALGVSDRIAATRGQSTTVGQGRQQPAAQQNVPGENRGEANAPARQNEPATTGQAGRQHPAARHNIPGENRGEANAPARQNQPATTGQAGSQPPAGQTTGQAAPRAQHNNPPSNNHPSAQPERGNAQPMGQPSQNSSSR
jgi:peptidoglycan hydrolase-like protein with peptidoglycan-binding domain